MNNKAKFERLMYELQMYGFVLDEARLFLDTHPNSKEALAYYRKYSEIYEETKNEFESMFGPITAGKIAAESDSWQWIMDGWPWQSSYPEVN